jgi:hypothetical protein
MYRIPKGGCEQRCEAWSKPGSFIRDRARLAGKVNEYESSINVLRCDEPKKLAGSSQNGTRRSFHFNFGMHGQSMRKAERRNLTQLCCNSGTRQPQLFAC